MNGFFQIDSDELLIEKAEKIIRTAIETANDDIDCFKLPRKNYVLGEWVKYGGLYPDWEYRLFRKDKGRWLQRKVHSRIVVSGKINVLDLEILHHGMPNISKQLTNLNRYTRYEADELKSKKVKFSTFRWVLSPPIIFFEKVYLPARVSRWLARVFLAVYSAIYVFLSQAKLKEIETLKLERSPKSN